MNGELANSYTCCAKIARQAASSFYFSFFLLPRPQRQAMCALYAFLRKTDDLGDSPQPVAERKAALEQWRWQLDAAFNGKMYDPIFPALVDTTRRYDIPIALYRDVLDGVGMDLLPRRFDTFEDLKHYCHLVASVVGLACIQVWGCQDESASLPARQCGIAFQLTNILRDLREDALRGRIYLPLEDLRRFDYSQQDLLSGVCDDRFRQLIRFEIERAEGYYQQATQLAPYLAPKGRRAFGAMLATYRGLLDEIARRDTELLRSRVSLTKWRKMKIVAGWALAPR
ncbi:MAG: phytoene/squalene synthase family protein [Pirellulales bacterium]